MKAVAIDTNVAIDLLNGKKSIIQRLQKFDIVYLPVTVSGELLFGAKNSQKRTANLEIFRNFIGTCEILDINYLVSEVYSDIRLALYKRGKPIPENDLWIAAICIANDLPLLTKDKHFEEITELKKLSV